MYATADGVRCKAKRDSETVRTRGGEGGKGGFAEQRGHTCEGLVYDGRGVPCSLKN